LSEAGVLSVSLKMDKIEYRAVIKFFLKEGLTPNEIHLKFMNVYGDSFADLMKNHYMDGIMALEHRWNKCISLKGDCVEE
jgi:hypothetical protein